jgi:CheY-like chemotaxis protein
MAILLVEDNPRDAELTIRVLKKRGFANHLTHVKDGQEALDYIFGTGDYQGRDINQQPRIILLDLKLPKVDGIEVLRQIRADERTKMLPVVVLTSSHEDRDVIETYQLGVNSYIVKPVDFENFSEAISSLSAYWLLLNLPPMSLGSPR